MAIPLLAAAALLAGGMGMSYMGQKKAEKSREATFLAERMRQIAMERQQGTEFADSLKEVEQFADPRQRDMAKLARFKIFGGAMDDVPMGAMPGSTSAPTIVGEHGAKEGESEMARVSGIADALARLGGTGDALSAANLAIGRNAQEIDQLTGFRRGSMDVLDSEMRAASEKGKTLRTLGGLATTIGQMALAGGLSGGAAAGGASGGTPIVNSDAFARIGARAFGAPV